MIDPEAMRGAPRSHAGSRLPVYAKNRPPTSLPTSAIDAKTYVMDLTQNIRRRGCRSGPYPVIRRIEEGRLTFHIGAKPGDIAETVLLPGDPYRARWAAQKYLENPVLVNEVRGMLGYTGTWRGHRVTIHGSGMGMPSLSIYANELMKDYGAQTLIRIGSAGALQHHVKVRDVVLAQAASTCGSPRARSSAS